jgi:heat shock protein HslJ
MRAQMLVIAGLATFSVAACNRATSGDPPDASVTTAALARGEWVLTRLDEREPPRGGGNRPATLTFDSTATRAGGFAGCNRYSGAYTITGDSLVFGPIMSTKMFCQDGDSLERSYLGMLERVRTFTASDSILSFFAGGQPLARFARR